MSDFYPIGQAFGGVQSAAPAPPILSVSVNYGVVNLTWTDVGACGYGVFMSIYSSEGDAFDPVQTIPAGTTTAAITGLQNFIRYYFVVKSLGCTGQGFGAPSNEVSATVIGAGMTTPVDRGGTIAAGGTAQQAMAANPTRSGGWIQNPSYAPSGESLYVSVTGTATVAGAGNSAELQPGQSFSLSNLGGVVVGAVSVVAATSGHPYIAVELT